MGYWSRQKAPNCGRKYGHLFRSRFYCVAGTAGDGGAANTARPDGAHG